jgi:16S rRNA (cytidine1402-2'-O)-methyltransferase
MLPPFLYIISTPIGNLKDITYRAVETLSQVDVIACEDTRVSHKLLSHYGISKKLMVYNDHSSDKERQKIIDLILSGKSIGLISDAGTPLISDPGYKLIQDCYANKIKVVPIVGASAPVAALTISGLPSESFYFVGFLPNKEKARIDKMMELKQTHTTQLFFESPRRVFDFLQAAEKVFGNKPAAVIRELTKLYEEVNLSTLSQLKQKYEGAEVKGEIVILIDNNLVEKQQFSEVEQMEKLKELKGKYSVKDAAQIASQTLNITKKEAYNLLVKI